MNYVEQFKATARLWWRTRALWPLGMLAALFGQSDYRFSANYSQSTTTMVPSDPGEIPNPFAEGPIADIIANPWPWILGLLAVALVWGLVSLLLGWLMQGAMISMVDTIDRGDEATIGRSVQAAVGRLPALVLIAILLGLPLLLVVVIAFAVTGPLLFQVFTNPTIDPERLLPQSLLAIACAFPLILIGALAGLLLSLLNIVAARSCVVEGLGAAASIGRAWRIIRRNLADTLINWVALGTCSAVFGVVGAIPTLVLLLVAGPAILSGDWTAAAVASGAVLLVYVFLANVLVGGALTSFNSAMWTRVYRLLAARTEG
jgi:hypothetical protein